MKCVILSPVLHNATVLEVGAELDAAKEVVEALVAGGAAELAAEQQKAKAKAEKQSDK